MNKYTYSNYNSQHKAKREARQITFILLGMLAIIIGAGYVGLYFRFGVWF